MSDVTTETQSAKKFDPEAFAMNLARAMESSGQALAAYLKPRENGEPKDKPPNELGEVIKTFTTVAEYWLSDKDARDRTADEDGQGLSRSVGLVGAPPGRRTGAAGDRALAARQALQRPRMEIEPVLRFRDAALSADHAMGAGPGAQRRRPRSAHPQEGRVLRPADHQRAGAVEFRAHQSGSAARDAGLQRRQSGSRHEDAGRRHRGRPRHAAHPPVRSLQSRGRRQHGDDAGQGDLPERADAADPVRAGDGKRAAHAASDRAAVDQQVLHPRSQAGKILHQMVRRSGHHGVRDFLGQPGQAPRQPRPSKTT